jgi:hypothetical protein
MDITPYATKKEKGKNPARPRLRSKLLMISGINGPIMFVRNDMTKKIRNMIPTVKEFFLTSCNLLNH